MQVLPTIKAAAVLLLGHWLGDDCKVPGSMPSGAQLLLLFS